MRICVGLALVFALALTVRAAVTIGDTTEQVVAEKGAPSGKMAAGDMLLLRYPDVVIKLKAGKVVAVEAVKAAPPAAAKPSAPAAPAPRTRPAATASTGSPGWITDYRAGLAAAKGQRRHVLLFFTGSDWCGWCKKMNADVLASPEFVRYAAEKLILVELDFPHAKPQPPEVKAQNAELAKRFQVRGYPTIVVLDAEDRTLAHFVGYQQGGAATFIAKLDAL